MGIASSTVELTVAAHTAQAVAFRLDGPTSNIGVPFSVSQSPPGRLKVLDALISMNLIHCQLGSSYEGCELDAVAARAMGYPTLSEVILELRWAMLKWDDLSRDHFG